MSHNSQTAPVLFRTENLTQTYKLIDLIQNVPQTHLTANPDENTLHGFRERLLHRHYTTHRDQSSQNMPDL